MLGPHRFTSLLAACAAFPLLASGLRWPDAPPCTRARRSGVLCWSCRHRADAGRSGALVAGGAGRVCAGDCLDGAAAQYLGLGGHAGFAGQLCGWRLLAKADSNYLGLFNTVQLMHTLALALALLAVGPRAHHKTNLAAPERSGGARLAQGFPVGDLGCGQQRHHITDHDDAGAGGLPGDGGLQLAQCADCACCVGRLALCTMATGWCRAGRTAVRPGCGRHRSHPNPPRKAGDQPACCGYPWLHRLCHVTCPLLGFDLCPRLKELKQRHLFCATRTKVPAEIAAVCEANTSL